MFKSCQVGCVTPFDYCALYIHFLRHTKHIWTKKLNKVCQKDFFDIFLNQFDNMKIILVCDTLLMNIDFLLSFCPFTHQHRSEMSDNQNAKIGERAKVHFIKFFKEYFHWITYQVGRLSILIFGHWLLFSSWFSNIWGTKQPFHFFFLYLFSSFL